jgi:hypothetical protein
MSTDSNTAGTKMETGEPGMVTAVMMVDTTGKAYGAFSVAIYQS